MGALMKWLSGEPARPHGSPPALHSINELRERALRMLSDCTRPHDERIRLQVNRAGNAQQLWLMRGDIYQAVACQHCEAEAARRVNELVPMFESWLPPGAVTRLGVAANQLKEPGDQRGGRIGSGSSPGAR